MEGSYFLHLFLETHRTGHLQVTYSESKHKLNPMITFKCAWIKLSQQVGLSSSL